MASITIGPTGPTNQPSADLSGEEKIVTIDKQGKISVITVNQVLDKMDDDLVERIGDELIDKIDDPIYDKVLEQVQDEIEDVINDRLDEVDPNKAFTWTDV